MTQAAFTPKQTRLLEIVNVLLAFALLGFGLLYQIKGWKLDGSDLILVGILFVNSTNFLRGELGRAATRVDDLEKRLAALESHPR
jgi:hypothetical protein